MKYYGTDVHQQLTVAGSRDEQCGLSRWQLSAKA